MNDPPFRRTRTPSTPLERSLFRLYQLSSLGSVATITVFVGYVLVGFTLHVAGIYDPTFQVVSLSDLFFTTSSFLSGAFICAMSGTLTLLTVLVDTRDANAEFVILPGGDGESTASYSRATTSSKSSSSARAATT